MHPISEFITKDNLGRLLLLDPSYPVGHEMRMRIIDSQFVRFMPTVTHFIPLDELEPNS
jgi:hypothetical protein